MLSQIPTHVIGGPLGAGKTSLIRQLLAQRPAHERWAMLINEFGQVGLDAALLATADDGVALAEVAGGCLCCVNGAPFEVGLARLLRRARPQRLLIEPSGLGHPVELLRRLGEPPWAGVLAVQPGVMVLDAAALAAGEPLPESQRLALESAGLLLLNKSEDLDDATRDRLAHRLPARPRVWTRDGALPLAQLPQMAVPGSSAELPPAPSAAPGLLWRDEGVPLRQVAQSEDGWSVGWRFHPGQRFRRALVDGWLAGLGWRRAKAVLHDIEGWMSLNALDGVSPAWRPSEWRRDSRLELIFDGPQDAESLEAGLLACREAGP
jgi:G3E family GTPase